MKTDRRGCSTCPPCGEQFEEYRSAVDGKTRVHYECRFADGELFTTIAPTLQAAREQRDKVAARKVDPWGRM